MEIVDNFLPKSLQDKIEHNTRNIPWYYNPIISNDPYGESPKEISTTPNNLITDCSLLSHNLFSEGRVQSEHFNTYQHILYFLEYKKNIRIKELIRARLRLTTPFPNHDESKYNPPHVDIKTSEVFHTFVYYINDSDGDTIIFNKQYRDKDPLFLNAFYDDLEITFRSKPIKGTGLFFEGRYYHSGNCPIRHHTRYIVNFDFRL